MCSYCYDVVDYIEHFFFDCPPIQTFWKYIEQFILISFDIGTHLTIVDVQFGIKQYDYGKIKNQTNKSYNFSSENVYKQLHKDKVIPAIVHDI